MTDLFTNIFGWFLGTFAMVLLFAIIPGVVVFIACAMVGICAAIPIVAIAALTHLAPKPQSTEETSVAAC